MARIHHISSLIGAESHMVLLDVGYRAMAVFDWFIPDGGSVFEVEWLSDFWKETSIFKHLTGWWRHGVEAFGL